MAIKPNYSITAETAKSLMAIEASQAAVDRLPMSPQLKGALMRELRPLQRQSLGLFVQSKVVTAGELADYLGIAPRQGRDLCAKWIEEDFLVVENPSKKARSYRLAERFEEGLV